MQVELVTKADIQSLKAEIVEEIRRIFKTPQKQEWLKSSDVQKLLQCSPGTLQNLRVNGTLPFTKMGGTTYYAYDDVMTVMSKNKRNAA
jgi:hypothetical protein